MNTSHHTRLDKLERNNYPIPIFVIGSDAEDCERRVCGITASSIMEQDAKIILIATGVPRTDPADISQVR